MRASAHLELAEIWAGPFSGALLSDLGAEVIKVEAIQRIARGPTRPKPDDPPARPWNTHGEFNAVSRNKLGITLDLTTPSGAEAFKGLVNVSDVVISNYAFGVMDRFGLGYEELRMVRPDVVALFMPGYGNSGPYRRYRSMGMVLGRRKRAHQLARLPRPRSLVQLPRSPSRCGRGEQRHVCRLPVDSQAGAHRQEDSS